MLDYHVILDLMPALAQLYFTGRLKASGVSLSGVQQSILLAIGLQRKTLDDVEKELKVPSSQLLAIFVKIVRKISTRFASVVEGAVGETISAPSITDANGTNGDPSRTTGDILFHPVGQNLEDELREGGEEVDREMKEKQKALIDALPLERWVTRLRKPQSALGF
jgi:N-acetyltransferase 10